MTAILARDDPDGIVASDAKDIVCFVAYNCHIVTIGHLVLEPTD